MHIIRKHGLFIPACLFALFLATGCFQTAGDTLQATGIAQGLATFTPAPSDTPMASPTGFAASAVETEPAATPDSAASVREQEANDAQAQELDPLNLTSTAIIERATVAAGVPLTATAEAFLTQFVPTATPTLFSFGTPTPAPFISGADCIHEVQPGDQNLWRISQLYDVTVHEIQAASVGLNNIQIIHVGDQLVIPGCGTTGYRPPPTSIPTNSGLDQGGGGVASICTPASGSRVHIVRQKETLNRISLQYGVSVAQLTALNCISNAGLIFIDQRIAIP